MYRRCVVGESIRVTIISHGFWSVKWNSSIHNVSFCFVTWYTGWSSAIRSLKCLETWLNCIVTCIQSRINYFLVTFNLTEWQRFILHPVLGIYHLPNRQYTYMYSVFNPELIQFNVRHSGQMKVVQRMYLIDRILIVF